MAYACRGSAYLDNKQYEKAVADCTEAIRLNPTYAEAYYFRGWAFDDDGNHDKAIADFSEALRLKLETATVYCMRGDAYRRRGDLEKAINDYTEAIRLTPKDAWPYYVRGFTYGKKGDLEKAITDVSEAIRLKPGFIDAHHCRGLDYAIKGKYDKAIADLIEAIRLDPQKAGPRNDLAWILAVCPDEHFRDGEKAIEHATRACELTQWREMICLNTLAAAYAEVGKFDKAVEFENKALEMATKDADKKRYHDRLILYQSGKPYRETQFE